MSQKNVVIKITAQSELDSLNAELQTLQDREKDIQLEMRKQQAEYQKQVASIQATVKGREQQIAALDKLRESQTKQQASLEQELKKTKATLTDFASKMSKVNETIANGAVSTPKLTTQLRAMKDELAKMEDAGEFGSKAFIDLSIQAGQLEDQIGDTRQRISILASDTKNLDAAMSVGSGLAGAFTVATSAAALLGEENEQLQKAFFKVQAVMSILNGVQQVANTLNKDSAAMVVIKTALEKNFNLESAKTLLVKRTDIIQTRIQSATENGSTTAKYAGAVASKVLGGAMKSIPFIAIAAAIAAVVGAIVSYISHSKMAAKQAENEKTAMENLNATYTEMAYQIDANAEIRKRGTKSRAEQTQIEIQAENEKWAKTYQIELSGLQNNKNVGIKLTKQQEDRLAELEKLRKEFGVKMTTLQIDYEKNLELDRLDAHDKEVQDEKEKNEKLKSERLKNNREKKAEIDKQRDEDRKNTPKAIIQTEKDTANAVTDIFAKKEETKSQILINAENKIKGIINKSIDDQAEAYNKEVSDFERKEQRKQELVQQTAQILNTIGNAVFDNQYNKLQQQQSDLEHYYTTDAEEAKKNKNLKLITEEEFNNKQLQLKRKMAKLDKEQAMFNIALATAQAIISALVSIPPNVPLSIYAGVLGGIQLAAAASKPLPKYAKGKRAGGKGHFAMVGELGPETMWVPDGAGIVPNGLDLNYSNLSRFNIPDLPDFDSKYMKEYSNQSIDYDKLGKAVADNINIPTPKPVTVNIDKNGITTDSGYQRTTHLNKKYTGTWK